LIFKKNYDLKTLFESVQVIEECFKFYQKLLGKKNFLIFFFIFIENKSKQLISLAKLTNETLTFSFRRKCVLYSNELLKLQGMYIKFIQDLLFSDDISRLFQAQTTPNQRLAYFFKSLDNPNKESSLEKMIQKKINIQFFSLRIINACLWFLIDCANSRKKI